MHSVKVAETHNSNLFSFFLLLYRVTVAYAFFELLKWISNMSAQINAFLKHRFYMSLFKIIVRVSFFVSEQLREESVVGVSVWLKLSEIMSSPPLHLTSPPPSSLTSPLYWRARLHHTEDPVERIFSHYIEKMQLRRLWDDRQDLLRASLPLSSLKGRHLRLF